MNNILEKDLKTYITRDYSVFKYLKGNRGMNLKKDLTVME